MCNDIIVAIIKEGFEMKKFLLICAVFLCSFQVVFAGEVTFSGREYLTGISYVKNNGSIVQYRNAQVIRSSEYFLEIAYCVEPFTLLKNNSEYTKDESYNGIYGINEEIWDKIKLYAYYGYGYIGHYDSSWISITQMSIWRTMFPDYQFDWIDNVDDKNIIYPYDEELKELKNLVDTHYTLPDISKELVAGSNGENIYYDSNEVLQYYRIKYSDFDVKIDNNNLIINTEEEKEGTITLQRAFHNYVNSAKYFYSSVSQNVIERGDIPFIYYDINVKVKNGKVTINKIDDETKDNNSQGDAELNGAVFELFNENDEKIEEKEIIDNTLEFDNLKIGHYYIKEKTPGIGYYLNNNKYEFIVDKDNLNHEITVENKVIKSKVKITKYYGTKIDFENNTMTKEKDIRFSIYDKSDNLVFIGITDDNGTIELNLPYGSYKLVQDTTTEGYKKVDDYYFEINEDNNISYDIVLNDFKIEVPNASIDIIDILSKLFLGVIYV